MSISGLLERAFGSVWFGLTLHFDEKPIGNSASDWIAVKRFCEAFHEARVRRVLVDPFGLACTGARYAFGVQNDLAQDMNTRFQAERGFGPSLADNLVSEIPCLPRPLKAVEINGPGSQDVFVSFLQPEQSMRLLAVYQKATGKTAFGGDLSSVVAVCGHVAVKAYLTGDMAVSLGCEDSRTFGRIGRDRLIVGLPSDLAQHLVESAGYNTPHPGKSIMDAAHA